MPSPEDIEGQPTHSTSAQGPAAGGIRRDIEKNLRGKGLLRGVQAAWVLSKANEVAKKRFVATLFRDGELTCLSGSVGAAELQLASHEFRAAINKALGRPIIKTIRFKQG